MNCKNCGQIVNENFCSKCGQNSKVDKINFSYFLEEITSVVFQIDKGLFYTLKELFLRPGLTIRDYLDGKRKNHFKPFAYLLTFSTVYFLVTRLVGGNTWMNDFISGFAIAAFDSQSGLKLPSFVTWLANNFAYASLIFLPLFSFASFLSFWGHKVNYLEHIVLNSYITGQQAIIYSIFSGFGQLIQWKFFEIIPSTVSIFYSFFVFWQFFREGNKMVNLFRSVATYILYTLFCIAFVMVFFAFRTF